MSTDTSQKSLSSDKSKERQHTQVVAIPPSLSSTHIRSQPQESNRSTDQNAMLDPKSEVFRPANGESPEFTADVTSKLQELSQLTSAVSLQTCYVQTRVEDLLNQALNCHAPGYLPKFRTEHTEYQNPVKMSEDASLSTPATPVDSAKVMTKFEESTCVKVPSLQQPAFIRSLTPQPQEDKMHTLSQTTGTFTEDFLVKALGGVHRSPGFNYVTRTSTTLLSAGQSYHIMDSTFEPYLPTQPGQHGAKLTAFLYHDPEIPTQRRTGSVSSTSPPDDSSTPPGESRRSSPFFLGRPNATGEMVYTYMGTYSGTRLPDRLSRDEMLLVPTPIKRFWTERIADPQRPEWVTQQLMEHLYPRPVYRGPTHEIHPRKHSGIVADGKGGAVREKMEHAWREFLTECEVWQREAKRTVRALTVEKVLGLFDAPDGAVVPGLRLWWEYLECVGYDEGLVENMVAVRERQVEEAKEIADRRAAMQEARKSGSGSGKGRTWVDVVQGKDCDLGLEKASADGRVMKWMEEVVPMESGTKDKGSAGGKEAYVPPPVGRAKVEEEEVGQKGEYVPLHVRQARAKAAQLVTYARVA